MCPRSSGETFSHHDHNVRDDDDDDKRRIYNGVNEETMGYQKGMSVLTVGDGDFTFALAVARIVVGRRCRGVSEMQKSDKSRNSHYKRDRTRGFVMATSYEDSDTLHRVYPDFEATLQSLQAYSEVKVGYNVDATKLQATLPKEMLPDDEPGSKNSNHDPKFHRICWNFPCTAIDNGKDGQNEAMEQNKELVRRFMTSALPFLDEECGEIHMAHKTKPPYNHWGLETVAMEGVHQYVAIRNEKELNSCGRTFEFRGKIVFDKCTLPPYTPRKAMDRKSFPCHDACIFVFGWNAVETHSNSIKKLEFHSTIPEVRELSIDVSDKGPGIRDELPFSSKVIPVTVEMIDLIRSIHLRYATQIRAKHANRNRGQRSSNQNKSLRKRQKTSNR